jgi:hypothetical protein
MIPRMPDSASSWVNLGSRFMGASLAWAFLMGQFVFSLESGNAPGQATVANEYATLKITEASVSIKCSGLSPYYFCECAFDYAREAVAISCDDFARDYLLNFIPTVSSTQIRNLSETAAFTISPDVSRLAAKCGDVTIYESVMSRCEAIRNVSEWGDFSTYCATRGGTSLAEVVDAAVDVASGLLWDGTCASLFGEVRSFAVGAGQQSELKSLDKGMLCSLDSEYTGGSLVERMVVTWGQMGRDTRVGGVFACAESIALAKNNNVTVSSPFDARKSWNRDWRKVFHAPDLDAGASDHLPISLTVNGATVNGVKTEG